MKRIRYFFVFGTELTLTEYFPYCANCTRTAARLRQGLLGKSLVACMLIAVMFLAMVISVDLYPDAVRENLFKSAALVGVLLALCWFYWMDWSRKGRTYYQPVSLVNVSVNKGGLNTYSLKFYNARYAALIVEANQDLILHGVLKVETRT